MILKNKTRDFVEIKYYDRYDRAMPRALCLRPMGTFNVSPKDGMIFQGLDKLVEVGKIEVLGEMPQVSPVVQVAHVPEEVPTESGEETVSDTVETPEGTYVMMTEPEISTPEGTEEVEEDTVDEEGEDLTCKICGREFASARGLKTHMKSHEE